MIFNIFIEEDSIRVSKSLVSEQVFGIISISIDNIWFFPEKNWDDFILTVLEWWSNAALKVIQGQEAEFLFMDGSFSFKINTIHDDNTMVNAVFFGNYAEIKNISINKIDFLVSIKKALNQILRSLASIGYDQNKSHKIITNNFKLICQYINQSTKK